VNFSRRCYHHGFVFLLAAILTGCDVPEGTLITDCVDQGNLHPVCGMQAPEDIAVVPGGQFLLLSELGNIGQYPGRIVLFDVNNESWRSIFPNGQATAPDTLQGDASCTEPPGVEMSPHGTHLVQLEDGSWRYLVVNHGGREAVELFALTLPVSGTPELEWQGCVFPADNTLINDVVGLSNSDVIFTRMYHPQDFMGELRAMLGFESGDVWRWNKASGLELLPGTEGSLTNGIEISADERYIFINQYMDKEIQKYDLLARETTGVAEVAYADNSAWGPSGELWLTRHEMEPAVYLACTREDGVTCGMAFEVVALDPETMATRVIFRHQGPPMGAATVATPLGDKVYLGSFLGDRLLIVPRSEFVQ
jgi:hypothetical protein